MYIYIYLKTMQITQNTYKNRHKCLQIITNTYAYIYMQINIKHSSKLNFLYIFHQYIMIEN